MAQGPGAAVNTTDVAYQQPADYNASARSIDNPLWERLGRRWQPRARLWREPTVLVPHPAGHPDAGKHDWLASSVLRDELTGPFSWSVTAPATVDFVAEHAGPVLIDPMAGTGYWAYLLGQCGVTVLAFDRYADQPQANGYHRNARAWVPIGGGDAADTVAAAGPGPTLLLAWPPYAEDAAARALAAYTGSRVIYVGEEWGCTADDAFHRALEAHWQLVAAHVPVCWEGIHDRVLVYDRKTEETPA